MSLSFFKDRSLRDGEHELHELIRTLYKEDEVPWVVGYSGGKDSTATLQLIWRALSGLDPAERGKPVHVISTDTLVENPIVVSWVNRSLDIMASAARDQLIPVQSHRLTPALQDTFWVNLIGRGYPAPRNKFRWCTERLKIKPSNEFIRSVVRASGEAIVVLGTRRSESAARSKSMTRAAEGRLRDRLSPNVSLPNSLVFTPIEDWSNDDVWTYLMQIPNPWGYQNRDLLTLYQGASEDGECPLVVDTTTPSCGDSRFGCWVCTLVDEDKSMSAMIQNDEDKEWMQPLLDLRNELDPKTERLHPERRDFRRMSGLVQLYYRKSADHPDDREEAVIRGPYVQDIREQWLRRVLEAQIRVRQDGPDVVKSIELISLPELEEIRRIWVVEKHEFEDRLPHIYEESTGESYPGPRRFEDQGLLGPDELAMLREICDESPLEFQMIRELLSTEHRFRTMMSRRGLFGDLERAIQKHFYEDEADALAVAQVRKRGLEKAADLPSSHSPREPSSPSSQPRLPV